MSKNLKKRIYTSLALVFLMYLTLSFNSILVFSLLIISVLSLLEFFNIIKKITKKKIYLILFKSVFIIYVIIFSLMFFSFSNFFQLKILLFSLLFGCVASDIGGFVFGRIFKGPRLTKISPNKTISGAIGSLIFTCIIVSVSIFYFTKNFSYLILIISVMTSIGCQLGDLFFSYLKRKSKLKDTGNLLPGHGGILDRIDGILLAVPVGLLFSLLT